MPVLAKSTRPSEVALAPVVHRLHWPACCGRRLRLERFQKAEWVFTCSECGRTGYQEAFEAGNLVLEEGLAMGRKALGWRR